MSLPTSPDTPVLPQRPAGKAYFPCEYKDEIDQMHNLADSLFEHYSDTIIDKGITDGVQEYYVPRKPEEPLTQLPFMAGRGHVPDLTPLEVFTGIRITSYRMMWDVRIQAAVTVRIFSQHDFTFYLVWRGIGPIYSPRDVVGRQGLRAYDAAGRLQTTPDFDTQRITVCYTSVPSLPGIPDQAEGCVRAKILEGGYIIEANPTLGGCDVTYFAKVDLALTIPSWISTHLVGETRRCVGRLRDALKTFGVPPILMDRQQCVALQFLEHHPESRRVTVLVTIIHPGTFYLYLDYGKMYTQGIVATNIEGEAAACIRLREEVATREDEGVLGEGRRRLAVDVLHEGIGGDVRITLDATDKKEPESGTGPGWW
ncbi:uncharacterized protein PFL1_06198 [Pseudozyma flocculosa PF-1]|uniref:START domain-containing protein n=2 Tax=Pseudozyma flocculosa TaxID=84751 RepID=A0A5C3F6Y7_9BASI|nr:uncharacterized protein PFL1_06198 [Pseudozyma flocculosa PF-1]EPQ26263.1 hypothetical protein PFL1_06198 [Pseudozyma flocculosa PF-1]SPO40224.1 uncharacterized protein PSFLO_05706 [Pseudozyma flocculosa]